MIATSDGREGWICTRCYKSNSPELMSCTCTHEKPKDNQVIRCITCGEWYRGYGNHTCNGLNGGYTVTCNTNPTFCGTVTTNSTQLTLF